MGALLFAEPPPRRCVGPSRRDTYHEPRWRKLSQEQEAAIRASAGIRTLRELAADFGVSHETVRAALRCRVQ
ncbi:MAG: GntR family transcriptional regulator [Chloroflexota bacterium]|nr:GntR family transcriptional regulator [Chloroflexota bacterium]